MVRLLMLLAAAAAGFWFAPQVREGTAAPCPALEKRVADLVGREAAKLPPGVARDPRVAQFLALAQGAARESGGVLAKHYVAQHLPGLPPDLACAAGWWKLLLDPDLGPVLRGTTLR
jgi:hypothetical protein